MLIQLMTFIFLFSAIYSGIMIFCKLRYLKCFDADSLPPIVKMNIVNRLKYFKNIVPTPYFIHFAFGIAGFLVILIYY